MSPNFRFTLTDLRYLVNLDRLRHFGRAAEASFVSQPTLSLAIKKLEEELGLVLFERGRGDIRPTSAGTRVVAQAAKVLAEAAVIHDLVQRGQDDLVGPLRVGAIYTVAPFLLPHLVPILRQDAPEMPLVLEENFTASLLEQLRENQLDAAIVALPVDDDALASWALYDEDFVVVLPREHRWAGEPALRANRLAGEPLLLLGSGHCFREQVVAACPKCIEADQPQPQTGSSLETIRLMVASGLGVTVLPATACQSPGLAMQNLAVVPFTAPVPGRRVGVVWRRSFPRMGAIKALRSAAVRADLGGARMQALDALPDGAQ